MALKYTSNSKIEKVQVQYSNCFDSLTHWVPTTATTAAEVQSDYTCSELATPGSIKVSPVDADATKMTLNGGVVSAFDASKSILHVKYKVLNRTGLKGCRVYLTANGYTDYAIFALWSSDSYHREGEWVDLYHYIEDTNSESGTVDFTEISQIKFDVLIDAGSSASVIFDKIEFVQPYSGSQPLYAISFDDGHEDQYQMAAYLSSKGIRGTFYIKSDFVGTSGHLTLQQLKDMHANGHIIANHTANHMSPVEHSQSLSQVQDAIKRCDQWLYDNGFTDGVGFIALPYGAADWNNDDVWMTKDILPMARQIRGTGSQGLSIITPAVRPRYVQSSIGDDATVATAAMNDAITKDGVCITYFHTLAATLWADYKAHIDAVVAARDAGDIDVVTIPEIYTGGYLHNHDVHLVSNNDIYSRNNSTYVD